MKTLFIGIFIVLFSFVAQASNSDDYNTCILHYLNKAKTKMATELINKACKENSKSLFAPNENKRNYNTCLLENLTEVQDEDAVKLIEKSCKEKFDS